MKLFLFITTCFYLALQTVNAQTTDTNKTIEPEAIFDLVEEYPSFVGGDEALNKFLSKNMVYPEFARKQGIAGKVWLSFIVDKEGNISEIKIIRGIGGGCDEEAIRVISMSPKWNPGRQRGVPVNVRYKFPITFNLK